MTFCVVHMGGKKVCCGSGSMFSSVDNVAVSEAKLSVRLLWECRQNKGLLHLSPLHWRLSGGTDPPVICQFGALGFSSSQICHFRELNTFENTLFRTVLPISVILVSMDNVILYPLQLTCQFFWFVTKSKKKNNKKQKGKLVELNIYLQIMT